VTMYHCRYSIRELLNPDGAGLQAINWRKPDGKLMTEQERRYFLWVQLARGVEVVVIGPCTNADPKRGCLGHPAEVFDPERKPASGGGSSQSGRAPVS
jgi:hypothetical protein